MAFVVLLRSLSTSLNLFQRTTVQNTDAPNCYINAVIISIRLLTCAISIPQKAPWDLIILWY